MDDWCQLQVEPVAPPEDWTGPMDRIEPDELGLSDDAMGEQEWNEALRELRSEPALPLPSAEAGEDEGDDEWGEGSLEEELRPLD